MTLKTIAVIGAGAAGFFGAIACAETDSDCRVIILEKNRQILSKVRISGGGRCNVTHACFDPALLVQNYPRGHKELRGPFNRFQPKDTIKWFEEHNVDLKVEEDGRMFPKADRSETVINCLTNTARQLKVEVWTECAVTDCIKEGERFVLSLSKGEPLSADSVLVAAGGNSKTDIWLKKFGHTIIPPVPSLFTFNVPNSPLNALAGISVNPVKLSLEKASLQQTGPLLITHWGFSGPAVLKLSAWGARYLHEKNYKETLKINWLPEIDETQLTHILESFRTQYPSRLLYSDSPVPLPKNLWKILLQLVEIPSELQWTRFSKLQLKKIIGILHSSIFTIDGKSTYKEEFVTCGGVKLSEVDFKTMQSKLCPGLYFAGEVLDIDGVTGGFNFQSAWTTSWIAGQSI